ncbi:putative transcription factor Tos4 [Cladophialophora carrionii]|uniref:Putative transcription factor Tos4 n=1 Tax=Cladophialophora carrionii TaxID=86049 RepID=A0A1C1CHG7_9EURO|nr:putative transcription factor Tos4 [Cladophialophora carrionii]
MSPSTTVSKTLASPPSVSKRPTTSLLPAFEPLSSSPALPRPLKRTRDTLDDHATYPTPVPTSSTAILSSSPARAVKSRPSLPRTSSTLAERTPLGAVPSIQLTADGKVTRMGRSSASCDYQFSSNRLISRVHVEACYKPAGSRLERDRVEITCSGWNGIKIHCKGQVYDVKKGETFSTDVRNSEIMIDVHDSRVVVEWPPKPQLGAFSSEDEEEEDSPSKRQRVMLRHSTPPSPSPMQARKRLSSPISPSPAVQAVMPSSPPLPPAAVEIYEDPEPAEQRSETISAAEVSQSTQALSQKSEHSEVSQNQASLSTDDFSDNDEENDPIIHSFGLFGANLLPRMASISAGDSPDPSLCLNSARSSHTEPSPTDDFSSSAKKAGSEIDVQSHIINQLAFSRLSSTPLSTILSHLPHEAGALSINEIRQLVKDTACIGEVRREGKDAAGKPLESEFYYIPDEDEDMQRKAAVVNDLRKPGLRACRKQHKVPHHHPDKF